MPDKAKSVGKRRDETGDLASGLILLGTGRCLDSPQTGLRGQDKETRRHGMASIEKSTAPLEQILGHDLFSLFVFMIRTADDRLHEPYQP